MIRHIQTDTSRDHGNCWQTAIACVIDQPVERVPHFVEQEGWWEYTFWWLWYHGYELVDTGRHLLNNEYYLVCGYTDRDTFHVAVYRNGKMVHDPHPSQSGLSKEHNFLALRNI